MQAHLRTNTDKLMPCTRCGRQGNIIREGVNPKLKCNTCGFMYDKDQSLAMVAAGAIPDGPPPEETPPEPVVEREHQRPLQQRSPTQGTVKVPRSPSYVLVSKTRDQVEFSTKKDLKKKVLQWETTGKSYEVFELTPKTVTAKVDIK